MRRYVVLGTVLAVLGSCSGEETGPRPDPEICDDEIDNDGDGDVDCDDTECGGLPCLNRGDDDDDTGTTEPPPPVEVQYDPESCCDFEYAVSTCGQAQAIGTLSFINRTEDEAGDYDISCDQVGGAFAIKFAVTGQGQPQPFLSGRPIDAGEQVSIDVIFACNVNQTFTVDCNAKVEAGPYEDIVPFSITGSRSD
jgi:hypothetical protein